MEMVAEREQEAPARSTSGAGSEVTASNAASVTASSGSRTGGAARRGGDGGSSEVEWTASEQAARTVGRR
ncbi:hypothetical protein Syun_023182 [Stephania yunnanensis]|uniref:Uncharacterized protein n=1 Tax=Stephania yunnanensis TaxID=152371 RepID=A0AAP0F9D2_9MAGN